jgi:hypothetical protein
MFRALPLVGGAAFFQRDGFFAAAPWRSIQATPQAQQKVVPVSGAGLDGAEEMIKTEIPTAMTYKLAQVSFH